MALTLFILAGLFAPLQGAVLRGRVTSTADGAPLAGANVALATTGMGAATGGDGAFVIPVVPVGSWTVTASHIGYLEGR